MMRWVVTAGILGLLVLALWVPQTAIGRRGNETTVRRHVAGGAGRVGEPMADFAMADLAGEVVRLADLRGHRVLLTFERSVDW
jgi:hypothetical protein